MKELEKPFSITIPHLIGRTERGEDLHGKFLITSNIQNYMDVLSFPIRVDAILIGICLKGTITITVNMKEWIQTANCCFINIPENVIGIKEISPDYQGFLTAISLDYIQELNLDLKAVIPYYMLVKNYPSFALSENETKKVTQLYELITRVIADKNSTRKEEITKGLFSAMVFMLCETLDKNNISNKVQKTKGKEFYFVRFMRLLLRDFRDYRKVGHYSDKLSITPKYLSTMIKKTSGMSAAQWIDEYLITEASILLKFSDKSIQQVADELNFPSQSFFSKYFKQHTGKTPTGFRKNVRL